MTGNRRHHATAELWSWLEHGEGQGRPQTQREHVRGVLLELDSELLRIDHERLVYRKAMADSLMHEDEAGPLLAGIPGAEIRTWRVEEGLNALTRSVAPAGAQRPLDPAVSPSEQKEET